MNTAIRILVVEDEFVTGLEIRARLEDLGYEVLDILDTGEEAVRKAGELRPDVMIMDITLRGEMTGIEAADTIRRDYNIPVIYLTAHSDEATVQKAVHSEPFGYLIKPLDERALHTTIRMALYKHSMDKALIESEKRYRTIAELSEDLLFILNRDTSFAFLNSHACAFFHVSSEHPPYPSLHEIVPPDLLEKIELQISTVFEYGSSLHATHHFTFHEEDFWFDCSIVPVVTADGVVQVIGQFHDISALVRIEKEVEKKGLVQIEHNMEQFQILNDRIRNPLAIIMSLASIEDTEDNAEIVEQVKRIDALVTQLDQGWVQSDAVRSFLLKHYGHGKPID